MTLRTPLQRKSLNYKLLAKGHPLFYDTLFASLRDTFTEATTSARKAKTTLWKKSKTTAALAVADESTLETKGVIFPKLFRRLTSYFDGGGIGLDQFLPWLEATKELALDLSTGNFTHLDNMLTLKNGKLRMTVPARAARDRQRQDDKHQDRSLDLPRRVVDIDEGRG